MKTANPGTNFLPITKAEALARGWKNLDVVIVSGDAYVDHPSFGTALIGRLLEAEGYRVGLVPQPDWTDVEAFRCFGRPELAFFISAGNVDSLVNHYTANRHPRREDAYSPGGAPGKRPDRALIVYTGMAKQAYKGVPVVIGGLEASLRRLSHYDYWSDSVRRSVVTDAKADMLIYGMGERQTLEIIRRLAEGRAEGQTPADTIAAMTDVRGTVFRSAEAPRGAAVLPGYDIISRDKAAFLEHFRLQYLNTDPGTAQTLVEPLPKGALVQNPPALPLKREELDRIYELPFTREPHPAYASAGGVPALKEVQFSITSSRGCFGDCSFCSITFHQGKIVQSRGHDSILREAKELTRHPAFKGYIHDVGGPTANFRFPACTKQEKGGACGDKQCLYPAPCSALRADHGDYLELLRKLRNLPGVKKVFIRSGIRYDYLLADRKSDLFLRELCAHHVSGQLKVAPEHVSPEVLKRMAKPGIDVYDRFRRAFIAENKRISKKQYLLPYFISAHPGSGLIEAIELALYLKKTGFVPRQVQDFYPTPGTLSTCMYYTGIDPRNGEEVYIPASDRERNLQRALLQFTNPKNYPKVRAALREAGREDLIGYGKKCLVPPAGGKTGSRKKP
jgi:uncharacterized radical SAM protein YgiQ